MDNNFTLFNILSDNVTRSIFHLIADERQVTYRDLVNTLDEQHIRTEDASERLERLRNAQLIEKEGAPLPDYETFYITANGLSVDRQLSKIINRSGSHSSTRILRKASGK
jgi:hypothetical protein